MLKIVHLLLGLLLAYIAWLQLNDPDYIFWFSLYVIAASIPLLALINIPGSARHYISGIATGFCIAGVAMALSGGVEYMGHAAEESLVQDMSPDKPYIEEARELIGALIALSIVVGYWITDLKKQG